MGFTIVDYYGQRNSRCGYCKGEQGSISSGMHAYQLMPEDYQALIDRGWRRCGHYCYKQDNQLTCCPCYTIRCDALEFKLSKSQKKILKRMNRFLRDGQKNNNSTHGKDNSIEIKDNAANQDSKSTIDELQNNVTETELDDTREIVDIPNLPIKSIDLEAIASNIKSESMSSAMITTDVTNDKIPVTKSDTNEKSSGSDKVYLGLFSKKAKQRRLERKMAKQANLGEQHTNTYQRVKKTNQTEKTLNDYVNDVGPQDKHKLKIILLPSNVGMYTEMAFNLYAKYQLIIHNDKPERLTPKNFQRFCYQSPLKLTLVGVRSKEFEDSLDTTYKLYRKYQTIIHDDPPNNVSEYLDFLQISPIKHITSNDAPEYGFGSYHQQYWLDDKLIAVAVLDILPYCVSSVYFFYDPDYRFLSLGTYSSLREIALVQELSKVMPFLRYYYMGFYIHSCPKMRYKGKLSSSYLLCPETYTWHLLNDDIRTKLNNSKYQRLNDNEMDRDHHEFLDKDLEAIRLLVDQSSFITYREYIELCRIECINRFWDIVKSKITKEIAGLDDRSTLLEYGQLVGKPLAHRMLYVKL